MIIFQCKNCKDNTYVNNTDKSNSNSYSESNECIINKLDKLQIDLNNLNSQFSSYSSSSNNSTILNSISNAISTLPDTLNKSIYTSFSDIVKSTLPIYIPTASKTTPNIHLCSSQPSVIIENISPRNRNLTYINSLFKQLELDPNTITEYSFISH